MSRRGKVARLPEVIREELNQRLADGEPGSSLLAWLMALPAVQQVLASQFGGRALTSQNLSQWRQGGFAEWRARRRVWSGVKQLEAEAQNCPQIAEEKLTKHLSTVLAAHYGDMMGRWNGKVTPEMQRKLRVLRRLCHEISALRRNNLGAQRLELRREMEEQAAMELAMAWAQSNLRTPNQHEKKIFTAERECANGGNREEESGKHRVPPRTEPGEGGLAAGETPFGETPKSGTGTGVVPGQAAVRRR